MDEDIHKAGRVPDLVQFGLIEGTGSKDYPALIEGSGGHSRKRSCDDYGRVPAGKFRPRTSPQRTRFIYVLEGTVVMQVKGGKQVILNPGQTFYEGPDDVHIIGRNASQTKPAKFVVFLIKDKGAPVLTPIN